VEQKTGGFSGSIIVLVKAFDENGQELDPRMMKFDDKEGLSEEFDCYQLIQKYIPRSELLVPYERLYL
jgi:hypothetical protein